MDEPNRHEHRLKTVFSICATLVVIAVVMIGFHSLSRHTLHMLAVQDYHIAHYIRTHKVWSATLFSLVFIASETLSLPIEAAFCILAGYFFGSVLGIVVSILSATIGASLTLLIIRRFLRNRFHSLMKHKSIAKVMRGIARNSISYVLFLRLVPVFPHFATNTALALSSVRLREYIFATFIGLLPAVTIFVLAGTQFATIRDTGEVLSPESIAVLFLLAVFALLPVLWKKIFGKNEVFEG